MNLINEIAKIKNIYIVEDAAQAYGSSYKGISAGALGDMAAFSFHETKNITCGEGGALLVNDPRYIERAEIIREKGTNRSRFFRGKVDKYSWVDVGSSYVMSDVLAAFLYGQLRARKNIQNKRKKIWNQYDKSLAKWARSKGIKRPTIPPKCCQPWHMYYIHQTDRDIPSSEAVVCLACRAC
jgi:dTDP-4-amino-4,6-dideoxygalactose transaminase